MLVAAHPFSQGPLPGVPLDRRTVAEALPQLSPALVQDVVRVHNEKAAMARNRGIVMSLWNLQEESHKKRFRGFRIRMDHRHRDGKNTGNEIRMKGVEVGSV